MIYYVFLSIATCLFSLQFLFAQKFENENGASVKTAVNFSIYTSVIGFFVMLILNNGRLFVTPFSLLMAFLSSVISILYNIASIKSFGLVNLSTYSIFAMLGGMVLPILYGIIFLNENVTPLKIICYFGIAASLLITVDHNDKPGKKIWYAAVFILNGLTGVVSVIHQRNTSAAVDSFSFIMLSYLFVFAAMLMFCVFKSYKCKIRKKSLLFAGGYAIFCSVGNLLILISLFHLPASVQYPVITSGVMVISLIISFAQKEKCSFKNVIATFIALLSTILIAF